MKLKKWAKMTAEIAVIQEELTTYLQRSQSSRVRRDKRTLSETEDVSEDQNRMEENLTLLQRQNRTDASLDMSVRLCYMRVMSVFMYSVGYH